MVEVHKTSYLKSHKIVFQMLYYCVFQIVFNASYNLIHYCSFKCVSLTQHVNKLRVFKKNKKINSFSYKSQFLLSKISPFQFPLRN